MQAKEETDTPCRDKQNFREYSICSLQLKYTRSFSKLLNDYLQDEASLRPFYASRPQAASIAQHAENRNFSSENREILHQSLQQQYMGLEISGPLANHIELLKSENTFTITTGHQLNLFTGPLYFIYKIATVVNACRELKEQYPQFNFVPVYWMASEDHDFDEINHFRLFGQTYEWKRPHGGPVGRLSLDGLKEQVFDALPESLPWLEDAYLNSPNLAEATRKLVLQLFKDDGVVVLDPDDEALKKLFTGIMEDEIIHRKSFKAVKDTTDHLEAAGYAGQVFTREINLFYMTNTQRSRIEIENGHYKVNGTDLSFSKDELLDELHQHPEHFSPNVILRPLYQETILPNVAYIGGPAEIAYWLQLGEAFKRYSTPFPVLLPRNFAMIINATLVKRMHGLLGGVDELFLELKEIKQRYLSRVSQIKPEIQDEIQQVQDVFDKIREKASQIDMSLEGFIGAEAAKTIKSLENIEKRLVKSEERNQETGIKQIESLKEKLFPDGALQERSDNFLNFYINNPHFVKDMLDVLKPFQFEMFIVQYEG
ncbi:MAG: bacillithiol biosynthesis cysteine-adding enzyme BshC [Cyclobacteriaceae bacterium]|nr:bacillithiol biosynthesis cysteine-adding enzyme BshC [Cyclobacteriaceae bacterium]